MRAALLILLIAAAAPRPARAGDPEVDGLVEQARREKAALRYREGLALLDRALRLGRSGPPELIAIHRLAGELAAGVDDPATATDHFRRLLALAPATTLPPGTSPKLTGPFEAAAADVHARGPLRVRFVDRGGAQRRLEIIIDGDPAGQVAAARVEVRAPPAAAPRAFRAEPIAGRVGFPLPAGTLHLLARVVDLHGNVLAERVIQDPAGAADPGRAAHRCTRAGGRGRRPRSCSPVAPPGPAWRRSTRSRGSTRSPAARAAPAGTRPARSSAAGAGPR